MGEPTAFCTFYLGGAIVIFNSNLYDCKLTESKQKLIFNYQYWYFTFKHTLYSDCWTAYLHRLKLHLN